MFIGISILFAIEPGSRYLKSLEGGFKPGYKYKHEKRKYRQRKIEIKLRPSATAECPTALNGVSALAINYRCYNMAIQATVNGMRDDNATNVIRGCLSQEPYNYQYRLNLSTFSGVFHPASDNTTVIKGVSVEEDEHGCYSYIKLPYSVVAFPGGY